MRQTLEQLLGRYLSIRPRSEQEVRRYLQQKSSKFSIDEIEQERLIQKYSEYGYISDDKFAESVTHSAISNKAKGRRWIQMKLQRAGVEKDLVTKTLGSIDPLDVREAMAKRLRRYENRWRLLDSRTRRMKAYNTLAQSGFSSSEILSFLDEWAIKG